MHLSTSFVLLALLPAYGLAAPAAGSAAKVSNSKAAASKASAGKGTASATGAAPGRAMSGASITPSNIQVANAVISWMNDTARVTKFLNTATSLFGDEFTLQATIAYNSEVDELNHKTILDAAVGQMASVQAANDTLVTKGNFQAVVNALNTMVQQGPDNAQMMVDAINMNRCVNVLPNIDTYFSAAGMALVKSVRPTGCLEVQAAVASMDPAAMGAAMSPAPTSPAGKGTAAKSTASSKSRGSSANVAAGASGASKVGAKAAGITAASKVASIFKATATAKAVPAKAASAFGAKKGVSPSSSKATGAAKAKAKAKAKWA